MFLTGVQKEYEIISILKQFKQILIVMPNRNVIFSIVYEFHNIYIRQVR